MKLQILQQVSCIFILLLFSNTYCSAQNYVTLKGRQFYDGNTPFYPICMTYQVLIEYETSNGTSDYFVGPYHQTGTNALIEHFNAVDCINQIQTDFNIIAAMGFNTVHVTGLNPWSSHDATIEEFNIQTYDVTNMPPSVWNPPDINIMQSQLTATDPFIMALFEAIDDVSAAAVNAGLKLIIDGQTNDRFPDQPTIDLYDEYLTLLRNHITGNTNIMAVILVGEPDPNSFYYITNGNDKDKKYDVCTNTKRWYNTLKVDPNILVGCGITGNDFLFTWDPTIQTMDFYFPHFYPDTRYTYEDAILPIGSHHNMPMAMDRINALLYWLQENCPFPWVVGETGFCTDNDLTTWDAQYDGDETEQQDYFNTTLQAVRNAGGSGYAVWNYQDEFYGIQNHYGLLKNCIPTMANWQQNVKPAAHPATGEFHNYLDANGQPPPRVPMVEPANYYDPCHTGAFSLNVSSANIVNGTVTDQNGKPIEGALLFGTTFEYWLTQILPYPYDGPIDMNFYTFTHADGSYTLIPFDSLHPTDQTRQTIRRLQVSGLGAAYDHEKDWWFDPQQMPYPDPVPSTRNFQINKISLDVNGILEGPLTVTTSGNNYQAMKTLTVLNGVTIASGASADFTAFDEVNVQSDFHAAAGSEVHIFTSKAEVDCEEMDAAYLNFREGNSNVNNTNNAETLELQFKKKKTEECISVFPNPNNGKFTLTYSGKDYDTKQIKVYDVVGAVLINATFTEEESVIDLSSQPKGIYFLNVKSLNKPFNKKIIIQ